MTSHPAFTHGPATAAPATKARSRSSCEALGQQAFGQKRNSPAIRSTGGIREVVGTWLLSENAEYGVRFVTVEGVTDEG